MVARHKDLRAGKFCNSDAKEYALTKTKEIG